MLGSELPSLKCAALQVMALVELDPLRDVLVGRPGQSGLSVEQRKRLTIAVELVSCSGHAWEAGGLHGPMQVHEVYCSLSSTLHQSAFNGAGSLL